MENKKSDKGVAGLPVLWLAAGSTLLILLAGAGWYFLSKKTTASVVSAAVVHPNSNVYSDLSQVAPGVIPGAMVIVGGVKYYWTRQSASGPYGWHTKS